MSSSLFTFLFVLAACSSVVLSATGFLTNNAGAALSGLGSGMGKNRLVHPPARGQPQQPRGQPMRGRPQQPQQPRQRPQQPMMRGRPQGRPQGQAPRGRPQQRPMQPQVQARPQMRGRPGGYAQPQRPQQPQQPQQPYAQPPSNLRQPRARGPRPLLKVLMGFVVGLIGSFVLGLVIALLVKCCSSISIKGMAHRNKGMALVPTSEYV